MGVHGRLATSPLRLGCRLRFHDRWQGTLAGMDVDENWEVLNLVLERGFARWTSRVKLAFSAALRWSYDELELDCTSSQAFRREIPPVAAPARQLTKQTPLSLPGARLRGLLVEPGRRLATDVFVSRGANKYRVAVTAVSFDGKVLHMPEHQLVPYLTDEELVDAVRTTLASNSRLAGEERAALAVTAAGGVVTLGGNVRTRQMKDMIEAALSRLPVAADLRLDVVDDIDLELAIGRALNRAGLQHRAEVYARSLLGDVTIFGRAPSAATVDEITRVVSQIPGVRTVTSRMLLAPEAAQSAGSR
jgi:osmotically-inducible protein OsmY